MQKPASTKRSPSAKTRRDRNRKSSASKAAEKAVQQAIADLDAAVAQEKSHWLAETGQAMPTSYDEIMMAARLAGFSPSEAIRGEYTLNHIFIMAKASNRKASINAINASVPDNPNKAGRKPKVESGDERTLVFQWHQYQSNYEGDGKATLRRFAISLPEVTAIKTPEAREAKITKILRLIRNKQVRDRRKGIGSRIHQRTK